VRKVRTAIQASRSLSPEEKATFHEVSGAGRSHVLRPFLGLTDAEEDEIAQRLEPLIDEKLRHQQ
jgi:hypothetical protein